MELMTPVGSTQGGRRPERGHDARDGRRRSADTRREVGMVVDARWLSQLVEKYPPVILIYIYIYLDIIFFTSKLDILANWIFHIYIYKIIYITIILGQS